jgi:hypothetical protein
VQELLKLVSHEARGDVVSMEGLRELSPWHLVAVAMSGGVVSPASTARPMKLLGCVQSLLKICIVQEPKLRLGDAKPVIHPERIGHLDERRRVHRQEVNVGEVQHRLMVGLSASSVNNVLHQHPYQLILRG